MNCILCEKPVQRIPSSGEFLLFHCEQCGEYRISRCAIELARESEQKHKRIDTLAMRSWLNQRRKTGSGVPTIGTRELKLTQSHHQSHWVG